MASALTEFCSICECQNLTVTADQWCPECDEFLCLPCTNHHKSAKISKDHKTVNIKTATELKPIILGIKTKCEIHNERLEFFCPRHDTAFCVQCTIEHKQCEQFSSLRSYLVSNESSIIVELIQSFSNLKLILKDLKSYKAVNLKDLKG